MTEHEDRTGRDPTLIDDFRDHAAAHPERHAIIAHRTDAPHATLTFGELAGIVERFATARALKNAGLTLADSDLIEVNEAFAVQVRACTREWDFAASDFDRLNVNGSGISPGHPVGVTGARILATLLHEMHCRGARGGLETMCIDGGQGLVAVVERV
jgi:acetyl-CoA C-acetyltransferase